MNSPSQLKRFFPKSEFTKNTLVLFLGTVAAQAIPLLLQPFLRRMYSPEDFGAMAVYLSIFGVLTIVSSLRYEAAIVLPKEKEEAANIVALSVIINIVFNLLLCLFILVFKNHIVEWVGLPVKYAYCLYFLPAAGLFFGVYQSFNYWLVRQKAFKESSINKITRRGTEGFLQLLMGVFKIPVGLFVGDIAGNFANVISGGRQVFKTGFNLQAINFAAVKSVFKKYIEYPKYNVIPTLLSSIATVLPFLLINKIYTTEIVGYLDLSRLVLSLPLALIATSVSQVLFQQIADKKNNNLSVKKTIANVFYFLLAIVVSYLLVVITIAPELFGLVFGDQYKISGSYSQILVYSFSSNFVISSFSTIFVTFGKIRVNSIWQISYFIVICSLFLLTEIDINLFLKIYVSLDLTMHLINGVLIYKILHEYEHRIKTK